MSVSSGAGISNYDNASMSTKAGCPRVGHGFRRSYAAPYNEKDVKYSTWQQLDSSCNVMAHFDAREGGEGETGEWSG